MLNTIIIVIVACTLVYLLRRNFRRAWYVLRTGDENPDWERLGEDYFIAPWDKRALVKKEASKTPADVQN